MIKVKRIYEPPEKTDGYRVLVDRLWARGLTKENAHVDLWAKEVAPSDSLRRWFGHAVEKWPEFRKRYKDDLKGSENLRKLKEKIIEYRTVTLLYGAKDEEHNNAAVLREVLGRIH